MNVILIPVLLFGLPAASCYPGEHSVVRDTTHFEALWNCDEFGCSISESLADKGPHCVDKSRFLAAWWGRYFAICLGCAPSELSSCRPAACTEKEDCPQVVTDDNYECVEGLCQNVDEHRYPGDSLARDESALRCAARTPRLSPLDLPCTPVCDEFGGCLLEHAVCRETPEGRAELLAATRCVATDPAAMSKEETGHYCLHHSVGGSLVPFDCMKCTLPDECAVSFSDI